MSTHTDSMPGSESNQLTKSFNGMDISNSNETIEIEINTNPSHPPQSETMDKATASTTILTDSSGNPTASIPDAAMNEALRVVQMLNYPRDHYGRPYHINLPLIGFLVLFRISRFEYGVIDPSRAVHSVHAAQLKQFISFAYRALKPECRDSLFMPIGYHEFVSYLHQDPNPSARLTTFDALGNVTTKPTE
ncbi:hypothetical protein CVT25_006342 [Psilocybe cyanescens]|uniref:Uncharacterized protein n=1 Tax=Psilocybe cyanescens TaxID=93625 RepID=A0A409W670_PSICY|nr:hypothetical protein CVT25_006342 [Psilocybe cyanescens]